MKTLLLPLCTLLLLSPTAYSATITPDTNTIDAVTVFLDRAAVSRKLSLNLDKGSHTIEVSGLPAQLLEASLRAKGAGPKGLRIASVESRRVFSTELAQQQERTLRAELQDLNDQKMQLNGKLEAFDTQAAFIKGLGQQRGDEERAPLSPEQWPAAWQAIGQGMSQVNAGRISVQQEMRELQKQIKKLEEQLRQIQTGRRDTITAQLHIEATNAGKADFTLEYQVPNATWTVAYDAHLTTANGKLDLRQLAHVRQNSGEEWSNIALTVSTARPSAGAVMPELHPWWVDFVQPAPMASRMRMEKRTKLADEMMAGAMEPAEAKLEEVEEVVAQQQASEFSLSYRIPGRVNVSADNSRKRFVLSKQTLQTTLEARTTPRRDPRAFLYANFDYAAKSPLLPGSWQLQRDGVYIGQAHRAAVRPGENVALAFGADDAIKVEYQQLKNERARQGLISREQLVERQYLISVSNGHQRALPVTVYDQIPVSRDEAIKVTLDKASTTPSQQDVEDRKGVLNWQRELKAGEEWPIKFGYSVSFPIDKQVPGF